VRPRDRQLREPLSRAGVALLTMLAVSPLAGGCSSDSSHRSQTRAGALRFEGGRLPGDLYLTIGPQGNGDLYRATGGLGHVRRLTRGARISSVTAGPGALVVSYAVGASGDRIAALDPSAGERASTPIADFGQAPDLSPSGRLAYTVPQYGRHGDPAGTHVFVSDATGRGRRLAYRSGADLLSGWGPGGRLAVARDGASRIVLDPGGPSETAIPTGLPVYSWTTSGRGQICVLGPGRRLSIVGPGMRPRLLSSAWSPVAWSGDGRSLLAITRHRIGLMSPRDGSVRTVGTVSGGAIDVADWVDAP
jgi:hypothetical protein